MAHTWDPDRYLAYADERGRPFVELLARVEADAPRTVVDLGCGPGNLTALLTERWPAARVSGIDASPEMVDAARDDHPEIEFAVGDLRDWRPAEPVDVLISNATLQWVPDHLDVLPRLLGAVNPGGWLAFQVPGNHDQPSHTILRELAATPPYDAYTRGAAFPAAHDAATYLTALTDLGCTVDAWETTYLHTLHGRDPVFKWVSGTGARPTLQALPENSLRPDFEREFKARLRIAYPESHGQVIMPFRRIFIVATFPD